jgi:hypothetical protein
MAGPASAQIDLTPTSADFGKVTMNTQTAPKVFTLANGPTGPLSFTTAPRIVSPGPQFKIVEETCPSELPRNSSCTISVVFSPNAALPFSGLLYVTPPSAEEDLTSSVRGEGISPSSGKGKKGKKCKKKGKKGAAAAKKKGCKKKKK